MGFISNDGDIIIDSVLTDEGRARLARGDGSFKIVKFALGDDEIVYSTFNYAHASGSAYYDLSILQTPIMEAFTNNISSMKSKLITIPRTNLLYLPILKLNEVYSRSSRMSTLGAYLVAVDKDTEAAFPPSSVQGVIPGESLNGGAYIRVDQGLDTSEISSNFVIDADLIETQYVVEIDNRFGKIVSNNGVVAKVSYIDDDSIASYYLSLGTDAEFVRENTVRDNVATETIAGPRGTILEFQVQASLDLNTSTYLFDQLGTLDATVLGVANVDFIDTQIRIYGATTGYRIDVPVRFIRLG